MNADILVQSALANVTVSALLALVAYGVHRRGRYPGIAHLLWVVVLITLVTPPMVSLPVLPSFGAGPGDAPGAAGAIAASSGDTVLSALLGAWLLGSMLVLGLSLLRIGRFHRLLERTSEAAPTGVSHLATATARQLGLSSSPLIVTSSARLSPLTWWVGGRVRIVIPGALLDEVAVEQLHWVLAHELAHVKRRDYLVRWLEWLACVAFWWNPVAWWARRKLRLDEEASCDLLVLDRLGTEPRSYARALLTVAEFLSRPTARPPVLATGLDSRGSLERRFRAILGTGRSRTAPRWLLTATAGLTLALAPLGVGGATERVSVDEPSPGPGFVASDAAAADPGGDDYVMLSATLPGAVATDRAVDRVARAERAVKAAKQAARQARRTVKEAKAAERPSKRAIEKAIRVARKTRRVLELAEREVTAARKSWRNLASLR